MLPLQHCTQMPLHLPTKMRHKVYLLCIPCNQSNHLKKMHLPPSLSRLTNRHRLYPPLLQLPPHHPFKALHQSFLSQPSQPNHINIRNLCFLINHMAFHLQRLILTIHIIRHTVRHLHILIQLIRLTRQCKMGIILMSHPRTLLLQYTTT